MFQISSKMPKKTPTNHLILGGARSGKSSYAETLAKAKNKDVFYIATAKVLDKEIKERVLRHQQDRPASWTTIEEPIALADALQQNVAPERVILVDCLTMWMTNLLGESDTTRLNQEVEKLLKTLPTLDGDIIFVSNEVGMGIIPLGELTRQYVDETGRLHQQLAQLVDNVVLMVAGLPLTIKSEQ